MKILSSLAPVALFRANLANYAERALLYGRLSEHEAHKTKDFAWCISRDLGYRIGVLQAGNKGLGVYHRIGFEVVGKISMWYYSKTTQEKQEREEKR